MIYPSQISSFLFFTPHPTPCFVVYCCGPVRLRPKQSWSLPLAWPFFQPTILYHQFPLLCLCPSYFCWTSLWRSPPSAHYFKFFYCFFCTFLLYLSWLYCCYNCNHFISITCFHLVTQCLTEQLCSNLVVTVFMMVLIWFCWRHKILQVKANYTLRFHSYSNVFLCLLFSFL